MPTTIVQNAQPLKRQKRRLEKHHQGGGGGRSFFMLESGHRLRIPSTVWIFILLFVVVVFLALLPSSPQIEELSAAAAAAAAADNNSNNNLRPPPGSDSNPSSVSAAGGLGQRFRTVVQTKRQQLQHVWSEFLQQHHHNSFGGNDALLPARLKQLRERHEIIGERLGEIQQGKETAQELLHQHQHQVAEWRQKQQQKKNNKNKNRNNNKNQNGNTLLEEDEDWSQSDKPPMELEEVTTFLEKWIQQLHETFHSPFLGGDDGAVLSADGVWKAYHDLTVKTLYPWDQEYLQRMPSRRDDESIFLSIASYRDELCYDTLSQAYQQAAHPELLFVGLVQQNCLESTCPSGVLANGTEVQQPGPDVDCYTKFCQSDFGQRYCAAHQVRNLVIPDAASLGPYMARYLASKLWYGESWLMQIDAHMTFAQDWDVSSITMLQQAPSHRPVLSHYPPSHDVNFEDQRHQPSERICHARFANSEAESQMIRLQGGAVYEKEPSAVPLFAPFAAAGYFVSHSRMLKEVPFDPFLPWIFMGEEIIMSSRLWTAGYDIFSPTHSVVGHYYVRPHQPKFWESVQRSFGGRSGSTSQNELQSHVLDRIKYQLQYPEAAEDVLFDRTVLTAVESYSMGHVRPLALYLTLVGLNMSTKQVTPTYWCEHGFPPPGLEAHNHLYPQGMAQKKLPEMEAYMTYYTPPKRRRRRSRRKNPIAKPNDLLPPQQEQEEESPPEDDDFDGAGDDDLEEEEEAQEEGDDGKKDEPEDDDDKN